MIEKADAVVIGGGIMGASTAHFLTKLGFGQVALVEKRKICGGSTQYSAAHVRQHYSNEVGIRLAVRGAAMFANAEEELGGPAGFEQIGYMLFAPPEGEQALRDIVAVQQSFGVETTLIEPDEVEGRWPELRLDGVALACHEPTSGFANPVLTVESLVRSAQRDGLARLRGLRGARHHDRERPRHRASSRATARSRPASSSTRAARGATGSAAWSASTTRSRSAASTRRSSTRPRASASSRSISDVPQRALLPAVSRAARCSSARAGRRRRSRSTPRPTTTAPTRRTCRRWCRSS